MLHGLLSNKDIRIPMKNKFRGHPLLGFKRNRNLLALTNNLPVKRRKVSVIGSPNFSILAYWFGYWFDEL